MKNIEQYSETELKNELEKRKIEKAKAQAERPKVKDNPDLTDLIQVCQEYVEGCINKDLDEDQEHWIFEEAMKAVFGPKIFEFTNKHLI